MKVYVGPGSHGEELGELLIYVPAGPGSQQNAERIATQGVLPNHEQHKATKTQLDSEVEPLLLFFPSTLLNCTDRHLRIQEKTSLREKRVEDVLLQEY